MLRLSGKTAFVTGGGTGIGRACSLLFAKEGAKVAIAGRRVELLQAVAKEIEAAGGKATALHCDVTVRSSVEAAIAATISQFGRLDVIVNNAGAVLIATAEETSDEEWHKILAANLTGTFLVSRAALPGLRKSGGGSIVNIGSILGLVARRQRAAYTAAKSGVTGLTKAMALDHALENIRVNCICPTLIETEMGLRTILKSADPDAERKKRSVEIPMGRLGTPEDVAQMALYLASDESAWVTGAALSIDGGQSAH